MRTFCATCGKVAGDPEPEALLEQAAALLNDWMVTMHHVPAEQLAHAVADLNARIAPFLASLPTTPATAGSTPRE